MFKVGDNIVLDPNSIRLKAGGGLEEFCAAKRVSSDTVFTVTHVTGRYSNGILIRVSPQISYGTEWYADMFMLYIEDPVEMSVAQLSRIIRG